MVTEFVFLFRNGNRICDAEYQFDINENVANELKSIQINESRYLDVRKKG